jgi:hypothetical protein
VKARHLEMAKAMAYGPEPEPAAQRFHVIASFDTREDLLAAMRLSSGWIMVEEPALLALLKGPHPPLQGGASPAEEPRADDDGDQDGGGPQEGAG